MSLLQSQFDHHLNYRWGLYGFWGAILCIGTSIRLAKLLFAKQLTTQQRDVESNESLPCSKYRRRWPFTYLQSISDAIATNLTLPPVFGSHHQRLLWWCYIPMRLEAMVVLAFWILNLILCSVSFETEDSLYNTSYTTSTQLYRFIADRAGIMAFNNIPILWVFSLRNNCFIWLTGWSFSTFMTFHRHISRIVMIQVIVHASTYSAYQASFKYLTASWNEHYWQMGAMAILAMGFIHISSSVYFRIKFYDFFLISHKALSIVFLAGLFYHVGHFTGNYDPFIWPLVGVWVFDRSVRIIRLAYCNMTLFRCRISNNTMATYSKQSGLIKLEVTTTSRLLKGGAGRHFFLYQPLKWRGWESHPFTLAGWSTTSSADGLDTTHPSELPEKAQTSTTARLFADGDTIPSSSVKTLKHHDGGNRVEIGGSYAKKLTFYIRPRAGWTMRLRDECLRAPPGSVVTTMLLEGSYGQTSPIHTFENVVFIVGGSGITVAMSYLQEYADRARARQSSIGTGDSSRTRQITLVWVARQPSMMREIITASEFRSLCRREYVQMLLFSTCQEEESSDGKEPDRQEKPGDQEEDTPLRITYGRPNITNEISSAINNVANLHSETQIAVIVCGPAAMADEARDAVHKTLKEGKCFIKYFEEKFGW